MKKRLTLVFLVKDRKVLLAMKKRGFGAGRWNGLGGKLDPSETVETAMKREAQEEAGVMPTQYLKMAEIIFTEFDAGNKVQHLVDVYICGEWDGEPRESEEMAPKWFDIDNLPLDDMWDDDKYWLGRILAGEKLKCEFELNDNDKVIRQKIVSLR